MYAWNYISGEPESYRKGNGRDISAFEHRTGKQIKSDVSERRIKETTVGDE
ncbi:colicin E3/pyocin S6 family cytotoxin [Pantoea agglomerans]|uniref:colicin E3/pyocin S6 family cytotoxin n=1 Tax=Enterobacter agglomerans TaxID=549 RepID=UPI003C7B34E2